MNINNSKQTRQSRQTRQTLQKTVTQEEEYETTITGRPGFAELHMVLRPGQTILSNGGSLSYMREGVERGELGSTGGVMGFFGRALAGQSAFQVSYKGLDNGGSRMMTFSSPVPGDIMKIDMQPNEKYVVSRESYIASSENVRVTGTLNWRGFFMIGQEEGFVLPELINEGDRKGCAWLASYGSITEHVLKDASETLTVDNGLFLAARSDREPLYTLVKMGKSILSSLFGGEGIGMLFRGPVVVYTQSHNLNDLAGHIAARLPPAPPASSSPSFSFSGGEKPSSKGKSTSEKSTSKKKSTSEKSTTISKSGRTSEKLVIGKPNKVR